MTAAAPEPSPRGAARRQALLPVCLFVSLGIVFLRLAYLQVWSPSTTRAPQTAHRVPEPSHLMSRAEQRLRRAARRLGKGTVLAGAFVLVGAAGLGVTVLVGRRRRARCR